jgi:hypothetical protein
MGKYLIVPLISIFTALSVSALAQQPPNPHGPQKPGPQKAAPVQRGPAVGARPGGPPQGARPGPQQGYRQGGPQPAYRQGGSRPGFAAHGPIERRTWGAYAYRGRLGWDRGAWRHEWRNGRYGWWWDVGGAWYFYEQPIYPYPTVVSDLEVVEDPDAAEGPPPDGEPPPEAGAYPPPPPGAYPPPPAVYVPPPAVYVPPPPVVCVGPLCVR